jgi:hypothetical protein
VSSLFVAPFGGFLILLMYYLSFLAQLKDYTLLVLFRVHVLEVICI